MLFDLRTHENPIELEAVLYSHREATLITVQVTPSVLQNLAYPAAIFRQSWSAPFATGGILGATELGTTQSGTPGMSVVVSAGRAQVVGTSVSPPSGYTFTTQAQYGVLNDAPVTLTIATSSPTNPRIDAVYIGVQDAFYSGSTNTALLGVVSGTPAVSPVAPSVPANSLLIATVAVAANATSIVNANIANVASVAKVLSPIFATIAALNLSGSPVQGDQARTLDTDTVWQYYGLYNSSTNVVGAQAAGWFPVGGNVPSAYVTKNIAQTVSTSVAITWSSTAADLDRWGIASTTNTTRLTAPVSGLYKVVGRIQGPSAAIGVTATGRINGTTTAANILGEGPFATGVPGAAFFGGYAAMNAGDYLEILAVLTSSGAVQLNSFIQFEYAGARQVL